MKRQILTVVDSLVARRATGPDGIRKQWGYAPGAARIQPEWFWISSNGPGAVGVPFTESKGLL